MNCFLCRRCHQRRKRPDERANHASMKGECSALITIQNHKKKITTIYNLIGFVHTWLYSLSSVDDKLYLSCAYTLPVCITIAKWLQMVSKLLSKSCSKESMTQCMVTSQLGSDWSVPHHLVSISHDIYIVGSLMHHFKQSSSQYQLHHHSKPFGEPTMCTAIIPFKTIYLNGFKWCINLFQKGPDCRRVKITFPDK